MLRLLLLFTPEPQRKWKCYWEWAECHTGPRNRNRVGYSPKQLREWLLLSSGKQCREKKRSDDSEHRVKRTLILKRGGNVVFKCYVLIPGADGMLFRAVTKELFCLELQNMNNI